MGFFEDNAPTNYGTGGYGPQNGMTTPGSPTYQGPQTIQPTATVGTGQNGLPRDAGAVNQNPLFDPSTNITPGMDIPLAGGTAAAPAALGAMASGPANGDWEGWFNTLFPGESLSPADLVAKEAQITAAGGKVLRNAAGVAGKIQLPSGQIIDVIQGAGSGLNRKQWLTGDASGGAGGALSSLGGQGFGGLLTPYDERLTAPTAAEAEATPGYQFARDQGLQAIDRSAAAKGTLLTGGTLKDLAGYAGGIASQDYGNLFNRNLQTADFNRASLWGNQNNSFNKLYNVSNLGKPTTP